MACVECHNIVYLSWTHNVKLNVCVREREKGKEGEGGRGLSETLKVCNEDGNNETHHWNRYHPHPDYGGQKEHTYRPSTLFPL